MLVTVCRTCQRIKTEGDAETGLQSRSVDDGPHVRITPSGLAVVRALHAQEIQMDMTPISTRIPVMTPRGVGEMVGKIVWEGVNTAVVEMKEKKDGREWEAYLDWFSVGNVRWLTPEEAVALRLMEP